MKILQIALILGLPLFLASISPIEASDVSVNPPRMVAVAANVSETSDLDPRFYSVVIKNTGAGPFLLRYLIVPNASGSTRSVSTNDPDVLWWRASPAVIAPGAYGEVRIKLARPELSLPKVRVQAASGEHVTVDLPAQPDELNVRSVRYDPREMSYCIYWTHSSNKPEELSEIEIDGRAVPPSVHPQGRRATIGEVRCLSIKLKEAARVGDHHLLTLRAKSGSATTRLFRVPPPFFLGAEDSKESLFSTTRVSIDLPAILQDLAIARQGPWPATCMVGSCLTHLPADARTNAWRTLRSIRDVSLKDPALIPSIHLCRDQLEDGLALFGRLADNICINAHALPVPAHLNREWQVPRRILERARHSAAPGSVTSVIPVDSVDDDRIIARTLLAISTGCAGIMYRFSDAKSLEQRKQTRLVLENKLVALREIMPNFDTLEYLRPLDTDNPAVGCWLLQMGPRRMAVVAIDSIASPERKLTITTVLPANIRAQRILDSTGNEIQAVTATDNAFDFTVSKFKDSILIFIELEKSTEVEHAF